MPEITMTLQNDVGLHARPAGLLARTAARFDATTTVYTGDRSADARSLLALLKLNATQGTTLRIVAEGAEAAQALQAIGTLIASKFQE